MKTPFTKVRLLLASLFLVATGAVGEDIDIYAQPPSVAERPNVLILIDNAASNDATYTSACTGTPFPASSSKLLPMVQCGLYQAISAIGSQPALKDKLNLALLLYGAGSNPGGTWWAPSPGPTNINGLTFMDTAGVTSTLSTIAASFPKSNSRAAPSIFQESWALLNGQTGLSGTTYTAPAAGCAKTFIIFIGAAAKQGAPAAGNGNTDLTAAALGATTAQKTQISTTYLGANTGDDFAWTDEWARYLRTASPGSARTYTIAAAGTEPDYVQHLQSVAKEGGGKAYIATSADDIKQAILQIFNEVQAVNSVFASSSLPVSVNAQGTYLNQIFMGMFRPDGAGAPRWFGNLKQFQFGVDLTNPAAPQLYLADSNPSTQPNLNYDKALSAAGTGFISATAKSFWTKKNLATSPDAPAPTGTGGYFANNLQGASGAYDSPDGEVVEKGGAGQQIRLANLVDNYTTNPSSPRRLYTCIGTCVAGSSLSATPFATSNASITAAVLGTGSPGTAITSIARTATTATVTLASAPNPAIASGNTVSISGSSAAALNGTFNVTVIDPTHFTYAITENPPITAVNTYTASVAGLGGVAAVTMLSRQGLLVIANAPAHGFSTGNTVTISGATSGYNGSVTITKIDANTFTYALPGAEGPVTPGSGGTSATILGTQVKTISSITRAASNSSNVSIVTVCASPKTSPYSSGNSVVIAGATPNAYNGTWVLLGGANAPANSGNNHCFSFNINTSPASPGNVTGVTADGSATVFNVSTLTRSATTCPTSTATATVTTSIVNTFNTGDMVSIAVKAGTAPVTGEGTFVNTFSIIKLNSTQFTYPITVTPPCASVGGTASLSGAVGRDTLIRWVRGEDNAADEPSPGGTINIRPSVHGDVLHSRPTVINYGGTTGIVVFYGSNDGFFRAVNGNNGLFNGTDGNLLTAIGTSPNVVPPGGELWGFIPTEFYTKLLRLRQNVPDVKYASTSTAILPTPVPKDYFFDGPTGVYQNGTTAYIYLAARRGGRIIYALDVSDPTSPKLLWQKTNTSKGRRKHSNLCLV